MRYRMDMWCSYGSMWMSEARSLTASRMISLTSLMTDASCAASIRSSEGSPVTAAGPSSAPTISSSVSPPRPKWDLMSFSMSSRGARTGWMSSPVASRSSSKA